MSQQTYEYEGLVLEVERSAAKAQIRWKGVSDSRFPGRFLNPLIDALVREMQGAAVTVDLRRLQYMNSATVHPMVSLVKRLDENGMPITVLFDRTDWQKTHRNCMAAIARTLKNVTVSESV